MFFKRKPRAYKPRRHGRGDTEPFLVRMKNKPPPEPKAEGRRRRDGHDFRFDEPLRIRTPWLSIALLIGAAAALFAISTQQEILLGQIAAPILGMMGLHGLLRGGFRKVIMLPVSVGMFLLVASNPGFADSLVRAVAGQSSPLGNGIACVLALIISLTVAGMIVKSIRNKFIVRRPLLLAADRFFGTGIGLAEGGLAVLMLCWSTVLLESRAQMVLDHPSTQEGSVQHQFASGLLRLSNEIDESPLEPIARDANLLEEIPSVRDALNNPDSNGIISLDMLDSETRAKAMEYWIGAKASDMERIDQPRSGPLIK